MRRTTLFSLIILIVITCPTYTDAQGSIDDKEGISAAVTVKVFLPMLVNVGNSTPGLQPYTGPPPENLTWLEYINYFRSLAGLPSVTENPAWNQGDWLHARYMVKNDFIGHSEDPGNPWYTSEGDSAARTSNLLVSSSHTASDLGAISGWIRAPFHGIGMLDPQLHQVGFGSFREEDGGYQMGAGLDVLRGLQDLPDSVGYPIAWPGNGSTVPLYSFTGEYPDPLSSCPGYTAPSGLPVILQVGAGGLSPQVTAHSFKSGEQELLHCVFDESTYYHPSSAAQSLGRAILDSRDAIVLIPKAPLGPGTTYTVSITVNGEIHQWSFSTTGETNLVQPQLKEDQAWELHPPG